MRHAEQSVKLGDRMTRNTIHISWQSDMHFQAHSNPDQIISLDAAPEHGGLGKGARPVELILVSLAGCTGMDVMSILRKKRQPVLSLEVHVSGTQADEHPRVYTDIDVLYVVEGDGVDSKAIERAMELSQTKYCPVWAMVSALADITSRYEIRAPQAQT